MNAYTIVQSLLKGDKLLKAHKPYFANFFLGVTCLFFFLPISAQIVRTASGVNSTSITPARDAFRADLGGGIVAGANGSFGGIRREINWDGVPDALAAPANLPANFFNVNSPRGAIFSTPGTGFQVSANSGIAPVEFGNINPTYPSLFAPFSAQRLFTALGSTITDVTFFVPGTTSPALTRGFGAIFSDVDLAAVTSIQYFDQNNVSLGIFPVPGSAGNETFSFVGVSYATPIVSRVRIVSGNGILGAGINENLPGTDLVVMDDFIYGEPQSFSRADLSITKTAAATVLPQSTITYTITVTNNGPDAAQNVLITDVLPAGLTFVSLTAPVGWTTVTPAVGSNGTVTASTASFANGGTATFTLAAHIAAPGNGTTFTNTATVSSTTADANLTNNSASASTLVVCPTITVTIPDAFALPSGVLANTVYIGYPPASSITLTSTVSGGTAPYTYTWSNGSHANTITVSPTVITTYTLTVTDANGCTGTASKTINVIDVRGGHNMDKVVICHNPSKHANTLTIAEEAVDNHLSHGDMLGSCLPSARLNIMDSKTDVSNDKIVYSMAIKNSKIQMTSFATKVFPNPSAKYFTLTVQGANTGAMQIRVVDMHGHLIEQRDNVLPGEIINFGNAYKPGTYTLEIIQGSIKKQQKIIKIN